MGSLQKQPCTTLINTSPKGFSRKFLNIQTLIGLIFILLVGYSATRPLVGADQPQCRSIYLYPSYARVTGFDTTHTKFASKYNLFLYREQGKDKIPDEDNEMATLDGIPVLFIPGNAGSYKQVRSIAAEASNVYFNNKDNDDYYKGKNFDFFSAHFNEDFTAFHGRTMLDQAEYLNDAIKFIISLYSKQLNPPSSVILIGHSMGGVVSRVMLTLPNYVEGSVNTIITLAAPHAAAPATFDGDILKTYSSTDNFWRSGFSQNGSLISRERVSNVSLISITGGLSDTVLPADYTTVAGLIPLTNGFTVYTSGIPSVWTPIDHLAIVWCDQLRKVLVEALVGVVDPTSPTRTKPLNKRMEVFKKLFLTGFEETYNDEVGKDENTMRLRLQKNQIKIRSKTQNFINPVDKYHLIPIFDTTTPSLTFLSSHSPSPFNSASQTSSSSSLLLCKEYKEFSGGRKKHLIDLTSNDVEKVDFECIDISQTIHKVPNSSKLQLDDSSYGGGSSPYHAAHITSSLLQNYSYVVYHEPQNPSNSDEYLTSLTITSTEDRQVTINSSFLDLLLGSNFKIPLNKTGLSTDIKIKNAWSSLLSYKVTISIDETSSILSFKPFIRQFIEDPFETKWLLDLSQPQSITFHGISPYTPFKQASNPIHLELWAQHGSSSTKTESIARFNIKIDLLESLKLIIIRYRLAVVSMPIFIIILVLIVQFRNFYETQGTFISFEESLSFLSNKTPIVLVFLAILTPIAKTSLFHWVFAILDPIGSKMIHEDVNVSVNPYFLGLQEDYLFVLGLGFYVVSLSLVYIVLNVVKLVLAIIGVFRMKSVIDLSLIIPLNFQRKWRNLNTTRRFVGSILLLMFVMFYIPYQLAYVICTIVQIIVTIRSHFITTTTIQESDYDPKEKVASSDLIKKRNIANFNTSILMLMIWLIPVNIPVLIVFFHNIAVRWGTPFSSHHNILAILPIILLIGKNVQNEFLLNSSIQLKAQRSISFCILVYFAFFSLIYGVRHLYWLHYIFNLFCAWLILLSIWKS